MSKVPFIFAGVLLSVGAFVVVLVGSRDSHYPEAVAAFRTRLAEARSAQTNDAPERLIEGTLRASATAPLTPTPLGRKDAVVWAAWTQVLVSSGSSIYRAKDLSLGSKRFELETPEGLLTVDATLRGASDLVRREKGPPGKVEIAIVSGDHVSVLGLVSVREGVTGFFGDVIVVKGTYDQWQDILGKASIGSIPEQP